MGLKPVGSVSASPGPAPRGRVEPEARVQPKRTGPEARPAEGTPADQERQVSQAAERLNKLADAFATSLRFSVHQDTNTIVVRVVETQTGQVIREIPPEQVLDAVARLQEYLGVLFDARI